MPKNNFGLEIKRTLEFDLDMNEGPGCLHRTVPEYFNQVAHFFS